MFPLVERELGLLTIMLLLFRLLLYRKIIVGAAMAIAKNTIAITKKVFFISISYYLMPS